LRAVEQRGGYIPRVGARKNGEGQVKSTKTPRQLITGGNLPGKWRIQYLKSEKLKG